MHQQVGGGGRLPRAGTGTCVARKHEPAPRPRRAHHLLGRHDRAGVERHRPSVLQLAAQRPERHPQRRCRLHVEPAGPDVLAQRVAEACHPVVGGERLDPVAVALQRLPRLELDQRQRIRQPADHAVERADQRPQAGWAVDRERRLAGAQRERLQHAGQAQHVIGVEVRDQRQVDVGQAGRRSQHLPLRALPAVDQDPLAATPHEIRGRATLRGRYRTGGSQEQHVQIHGPSLGESPVTGPATVSRRGAAAGGRARQGRRGHGPGRRPA